MNTSEMRIAATNVAPELRLARFWWSAGWAMVVFITISCLEPPRYVPTLHLWDKLEHAIAFFGMSVWFGGLVRRSRYPVIGLLLLLFGGGIEIAQGAMRFGRDEDIMDFAADAVGIASALVVLYLGLGAWARWVEWFIWRPREPS